MQLQNREEASAQDELFYERHAFKAMYLFEVMQVLQTRAVEEANRALVQ